MKKYKSNTISKSIVKFCIANNKRFLFISGNGGAGKTELSKVISEEVIKYGHVNLLDMDDFVVDTKLRNNANITWKDTQGNEQSGRYTTSFAESYFLQNIKAIIYNTEEGNNYYHWPKKASNSEECRLLYSDAVLTIIEGTGTVFLEKDKSKSVSIFMQCKTELEISRRINRAQFSNEKNSEEVLKNFDKRNSQYKANIEPHMSDYDIVLESIGDFSLNVLRDDFNILV